jgi:hypothetical protein
MFLGNIARPARKADVTAICEHVTGKAFLFIESVIIHLNVGVAM